MCRLREELVKIEIETSKTTKLNYISPSWWIVENKTESCPFNSKQKGMCCFGDELMKNQMETSKVLKIKLYIALMMNWWKLSFNLQKIKVYHTLMVIHPLLSTKKCMGCFCDELMKTGFLSERAKIKIKMYIAIMMNYWNLGFWKKKLCRPLLFISI